MAYMRDNHASPEEIVLIQGIDEGDYNNVEEVIQAIDSKKEKDKWYEDQR